MTKRELACLIRKSPAWVGKCLDLTNLLKDIQVMVDRGEIPVENAYMLAKIPRSMQKDYVDRAKTHAAQGVPTSWRRPASSSSWRRSSRERWMPSTRTSSEPVAHLRSLKEIEEEMRRSSRSTGLYGRGMSDGARRLLCGPALGLPSRSSQCAGTRGQ